MQAKLVVVGGRANKQEVDIRLPYSIGRSDDANLTIEHRAISRQHCELVERQGQLVLRDVGSANGTFIGERQITGEEVLAPGDTFTIGPLTFRAVYETAAAPVADQPTAARTLYEEDAPTPSGNDLALSADELELDSFDLELSDDIDLPEITHGEQLAADDAAETSSLESAELSPEKTFEPDLNLASEDLSLPLDIDEPEASEMPRDLAESLELDALESDAVDDPLTAESDTIVREALSVNDASLDLDLELDFESEPLAASSAPPLEEDDAPTEIGDFVDLRADDEPAVADSTSAITDELEELSEVSDELLDEVGSLEDASQASTEPAPTSATDDGCDEHELRDFSDSSHIDDAPSQELFTVYDEEVETSAAAPAHEETADVETPWVDLEDEIAPQEEAIVDDEPAGAPSVEELVAAEEPIEELELEGIEADELSLEELAAEEKPVEELKLENFEVDEISVEEPLASEPLAEASAEDHLPAAVEPDDIEALSMDEPPAEPRAAETLQIFDPAEAEEDELALDDMLLDEPMPQESLAPPEPEAAAPDFTAWMFEESLTEPVLEEREAPVAPVAESHSEQIAPLAEEEGDLELLDFPAVDAELPDEGPAFEQLVADELAPDDAIGATPEPLAAELPPEELQLDEFQLEDSVEESDDIEFDELDSAADPVEEAAPPAEESISHAADTEPLVAESREEAPSDELNFDDWVAGEITSLAAPHAAEQAPLDALDDPVFAPFDESTARDEAAEDEPLFDEADVRDEELKLDDVAQIEEEFQLDEELNFEDEPFEPGGRHKLELPAVFEEVVPHESAEADVEIPAADEGLPPAVNIKEKRSWWPFGRGKRANKPAARAKKTKKAKQALDAAASLPAGELPREAAVEPDEIEFSLDDARETAVDEPRFDALNLESAEEAEFLASEPKDYHPTDPLDELDFPLDDGGASLAPADLAEVEPTFEGPSFPEPKFEDFAASAADDASPDEFASLDDAPAFSLDDDEPELVFDEVEPTALAPPDTAKVDAGDKPLPDESGEKSGKLWRTLRKPQAEPPVQPRRRWWPFGGKKKDAAAAEPEATRRGRAAKSLRSTLTPDELLAPENDASSSVEETDEQRIARRLVGPPSFEDDELTFDEAEPSFEEAAIEELPHASSDESRAIVDDGPPASVIEAEGEARAFTLEEEDEAPAFELDDEVREFVDEDDAAPTTNKTRTNNSERAAGAEGAWAAHDRPSDSRAERPSAPQDAEDDWDNFLKSFDS